MDNLSLEIKKGEVLGILGKNGAGKSTLLKMITGVVSPTSGKIEVEGKISSLLELGAAFNPELTGIENIYQHGQNYLFHHLCTVKVLPVAHHHPPDGIIMRL